MFQYISRRQRAGPGLWLIEEASRAPCWGVRVTRSNVGILGEVGVQFGILSMGEEFVMIDFCNGGSRGGYISLGEETCLCLRFDLCCGVLGSRRL